MRSLLSLLGPVRRVKHMQDTTANQFLFTVVHSDRAACSAALPGRVRPCGNMPQTSCPVNERETSCRAFIPYLTGTRLFCRRRQTRRPRAAPSPFTTFTRSRTPFVGTLAVRATAGAGTSPGSSDTSPRALSRFEQQPLYSVTAARRLWATAPERSPATTPLPNAAEICPFPVNSTGIPGNQLALLS